MMEKFNPVRKLSTKHGAPMGRADIYSHIYDFERNSLYLRRILHSFESYDKGGAYWGHGEPVYALWHNDGSLCLYIRGKNRESVKEYISEKYGLEDGELNSLLKQSRC